MKDSITALLVCIFLCQISFTWAQENTAGTGTVNEAIDTGSYIYILLDNSDTWIATGPTDVVTGDKITWSDGMEMQNFHSKALDRTFKSIYFVQKIEVEKRNVESLHKNAKIGHSSGIPNIPSPATVSSPKPGEIERLAGGKTIAEIQSDSTAMNEQSVNLRAKVIKVSANIMGKNWITLQDGTGTAPNDKLLATSSQMVAPGDLVTVKGVVRNDVDLGSGYRYNVLLEEATFTK